MLSVAVLGGGISGLSAAYRLAQHHVQVTLFEASARVGGVIQSGRQDGYLVEYGPSSIEGLDPVTEQLIQELDLASLRTDAHPSAKKLSIVRRGQPVAVPLSAAQFVTSPLFSPLGKLRLLMEPFIRPGNAHQKECITEFANRRLGKECCQYVISPFVTGVLAGDPARLSVQHALPDFYQAEQRYGSLTRGFLARARARRRQAVAPIRIRTMFSFQEGLQTLTDALYTRIQASVRLNTPVIHLRQLCSGWAVTTGHREQTEENVFDAIISTVPLYQFPTISSKVNVDLSPLREVEYPPLSILALGFRREQITHPLDGLGMLVPMVEGLHILGTLFSSTVYPARAPEGHVLLTTFIGGACKPDLAKQPTDTLLEVALRELRATLGITGQPVFLKHIYLNHSLPQYQSGHGRVVEYIEQLEKQLPGFFMVGNYRQGVSVRDALCSGYEAAERLVAPLSLATVT